MNKRERITTTSLIISKHSIWPFCAIFMLILFSCEKETNTPSGEQDQPSKPEIIMLEVSPGPQLLDICGEEDPRTIPLNSTDTFSLRFNVKATNGLSEYKIDIHHNFDCHGHPKGPTTAVPWKVLEINNLDGQDITVTKKLVVPEDVQAGNYHFVLQALDLTGNEADWILYSLKIKNKEDVSPPVVELPDLKTDSISISKTESVNIEMKISDDQALYGGRLDIFYLDPSETEFTAQQYFFQEDAGSESTYNFSYSFPTTPALGIYTFIIKAYDAVGNETQKQVKVNIEE